jgi:DedD protein
LATQFQNRLIGTVILVSLGVIFLPDFLSGKRSNHHDPIASVPLRPDATAPLAAVSAAPGTAVVANAASTGTSTPEGVVVNNNASADEQWSVDEVAPTVVAGTDQAGQVIAAKPTAATATPNTSVSAKPKSETKPVVVKSVEAKVVEVKPVEAKPVKPVLQAGQIKPFVEVVEAKPAATSMSASTPQPLVQPKPLKPSATSGAAWTIQAGVFSSGDNARALVGKLRASGLPANVSSFRSGSSTLYRVTVGPDVSRDKLDRLVPRVSQIAGASAKVIAYNPLG